MSAVKDQAPLAGVVMCCTSIAPDARHLIATTAEEMGAVHKFDLTSDVTHLIIGDVDTPKYKYVAKERPDVKVVIPSFVDAVRQVWIEGGDVVLSELEKAHEAPALMDFKICLTGFESTTARDNIRAAVVDNGAEFHGDLTKQVTHLIAASPEGKKYEHARRWGIKVVAFEWIQDSIQRGMALEEQLYDPILAPQDRGKGAYNKTAMEKVTLGKRQREPEERAPEPPARRKLRRTMSKKMESQQETIWADIAAGSGQAMQEPPEIDSVLGVLPQPQASQEHTPEATVEPTRRKPSAPAPELHKVAKNREFQDLVIYAHGLTTQNGFPPHRRKRMQDLVEERGGRFYTSEPPLRTKVDELDGGFLITPAAVPAEELSTIPESLENLQRVTEWWIESCIGHKRPVGADHLLCQPFTNHKVEGFENLTIASTGFTDFDLLHVGNAVKMMGANFFEGIQVGVDVVIFNSEAPINKDKLEFAVENRIHAVNERWLIDCIEQGFKQNLEPYMIKTETPTVPVDYEPPKVKLPGFKPSMKSSYRSSLDSEIFTSALDGTMEPGQLEMQAPDPMPRKQKPTMQPKSKPTKSRTKQTGPFLDDDEDETTAMPDVQNSRRSPSRRPASQPLGELSQVQQNSQRRVSQPSQQSQTLRKERHSPSLPQDENFEGPSAAAHLVNETKVAAGPDTSQPQPTASQQKKGEQLTNAISALLAAKQRRPTSASSNSVIDPMKRKRTLGRAPSGGSFGSARADSVDSTEERREPMKLPDPSQKIIYEDEAAQEERRKLIRMMGGTVDETEERRVKGVGVVKDISSGGAGIGGRGARKGKR